MKTQLIKVLMEAFEEWFFSLGEGPFSDRKIIWKKSKAHGIYPILEWSDTSLPSASLLWEWKTFKNQYKFWRRIFLKVRCEIRKSIR